MENVSTISSYAFEMCVKLSTMHLPEITKIGDSAFSNCQALESIELGSKLTYIGKLAFLNCAEIDVLTLPESVSYVGSECFGQMTKDQLIVISTPSGIRESWDPAWQGQCAAKIQYINK